MEFARLVSSNDIEQRDEFAKGDLAGDLAWSDLNFRSFGLAERPLEKVEWPMAAVCCTGSFGIDAGCSQPGAAVKMSFIYLTNQYFSGCLMLHAGYRLREFHHIREVPSRLA